MIIGERGDQAAMNEPAPVGVRLRRAAKAHDHGFVGLFE